MTTPMRRMKTFEAFRDDDQDDDQDDFLDTHGLHQSKELDDEADVQEEGEVDGDLDDDGGDARWLSAFRMSRRLKKYYDIEEGWWPLREGDDFDYDTLIKLTSVHGRGLALWHKVNEWLSKIGVYRIGGLVEMANEILDQVATMLDDDVMFPLCANIRGRGLPIVGGDYLEQLRLFLAKVLNRHAANLLSPEDYIKALPKIALRGQKKFWLGPGFKAAVALPVDRDQFHINYLTAPGSWKWYLLGTTLQNLLWTWSWFMATPASKGVVNTSIRESARKYSLATEKFADLVRHSIESGVMISPGSRVDDVCRGYPDDYHLKRILYVYHILSGRQVDRDLPERLCTGDDVGALLKKSLPRSGNSPNPARFFEAIKRYIDAHRRSPTRLMTELRKAFPVEYDAAFPGDTEWELGDLGM